MSLLRRTKISKSILKDLIFMGGLGVLVTGAYEVFSLRATLWGRVLTHGPRGVSAIGLVFDQSPNNLTEAICRRLHELETPATFFIEGKRARRNPRALRSLQAFEIGIHGEDYSPLIFQNKWELKQGLRPCLTIADDVQGRDPRFLMPPHGWKDLRLIRVAKELGLLVINPSLELRWSKDIPYSDSVGHLLRRIGPGDIILVENDPQKSPPQSSFIELLTMLIAGIRDKGLKIWGLSPLVRLLG
ncbi:MAG: polysaccharide deacetylase family protein [Nitrospiraceae bacterium]|nr:polysaccharide deacetylase family protein [Nitrospiraceae bacterium]